MEEGDVANERIPPHGDQVPVVGQDKVNEDVLHHMPQEPQGPQFPQMPNMPNVLKIPKLKCISLIWI